MPGGYHCHYRYQFLCAPARVQRAAIPRRHTRQADTLDNANPHQGSSQVGPGKAPAHRDTHQRSPPARHHKKARRRGPIYRARQAGRRCRGRFIVPTADLSAPGSPPTYPNTFVTLHYRACAVGRGQRRRYRQCTRRRPQPSPHRHPTRHLYMKTRLEMYWCPLRVPGGR